MKRSAPNDEAGDPNPGDSLDSDVNGNKRKKPCPNVWPHNGEEYTGPDGVSVNEAAPEALRIVTKQSGGSLILSFRSRNPDHRDWLQGAMSFGKIPRDGANAR